MAFAFQTKSTVIPEFREAPSRKRKGPAFGDLAAQAKRALRDGGGVDVTGMSREERAKAFFGE